MHVRLLTLGGMFGPEANFSFGATCYLLIITLAGITRRYLIDCGMSGNVTDALTSWRPPIGMRMLENIPSIDMILLTHAHRDHCAGIGLQEIVSRLAPNAKIIGTRPTMAMLPYVLMEQSQISDQRREQPPYSLDEIYTLAFDERRIHRVMEPGVLELVPGVEVLAMPSGHMHGSCFFIFRIKEGKKVVKIMFSGDYAVHRQDFLAGAARPPRAFSPDIIASFDCTNGLSQLHSWGREAMRFQRHAEYAMAQGEVSFCFASAIDRAHIVAQVLAQTGMPVYLDGAPSLLQFTRLFQTEEGSWSPNDPPLVLEGVEQCTSSGEALNYPAPCGIVAPSAQGHGPATRYLREFLPRENAHISAVGLLPPASNGYRIMRAQRGDKIMLVTEDGPVEIVVNAHCEQYGMTTHSLPGPAIRRIHELLRHSCFLHVPDHPLVGLSHGRAGALDALENALSDMETFRTDNPLGRDIVLVD